MEDKNTNESADLSQLIGDDSTVITKKDLGDPDELIMPEGPELIELDPDIQAALADELIMPEGPELIELDPDLIEEIQAALGDPSGWQPIAGTGDGVLLNTGAAEGGWTNINDLTGDNPVLEIGGIELHS